MPSNGLVPWPWSTSPMTKRGAITDRSRIGPRHMLLAFDGPDEIDVWILLRARPDAGQTTHHYPDRGSGCRRRLERCQATDGHYGSPPFSVRTCNSVQIKS